MKIKDKTIHCEKCPWKWKLSDGGKDPYTCHKCGNKNRNPNSLNVNKKCC